MNISTSVMLAPRLRAFDSRENVDMERPWVIYVLKDPRDGAVRYVGWTVNLRTRIRDHMKPSQLAAHGTRRDNWLRVLDAAGLKPIVEVIETGSRDWAAAECKWIAHYRTVGADLTNHTDGGEGSPGRRHTDAAKAAMSAKRKGRVPSPQCFAATIAATKGKSRSQEYCARMSEMTKGVPKSEAHRLALSIARTGTKMSVEARAKMSAARRGRKFPPRSEESRRRTSEAKKGKPNLALRARWASDGPAILAKRMSTIRERS